MIKSYTVTTTEVDDAEEAVRQVAEKTASAALLKNSIGIITAHPEFVTSGVYSEVAKALPFPTIGATSISHYADGIAETYMLSVLILTSDDCSFSCGLSATIPKDGSGGALEITRECYEETRGKLSGEPKLALLYAPFFGTFPRQGDYLEAITGIDAKLPVFGSVANDDLSASTRLIDARTFYNGESYDDRFAIALVSGGINPKFYINSLTEESIIMPRVGVITKIDGNKILEINSVSATEFFKNIGFLGTDPQDRDKGLLSSIFVLHIKDENGVSADISRIPAGVEDDGVMCGGRLVTGAVLSIAFNTKDVVLETAKNLMDAIKENHSGGTVILHSCIGRRYGLLSEPMRELELIRDALGGGFNYTADYANGEICPTAVSGVKASNQEHNQTLVACVF
ncbi:MAG: FIST C-terminal domain-containing protein [Chitinispirillales bacterium]|jgi:hypothetical protein|nr:FIST C-terminal domain-containing protein [Chitinispirillales bacterium]